MIKNLKFSVQFSNNKKLSNEFNFEAGSTLITGKNGRGKSMTFEMIAYGLFGASALRGTAADYKTISVDLVVAIKGKTYHIIRGKTKAEIRLEGITLVSGVKAVNLWILRTLGYNYDVFRIAHWCAQGDIQALANMKPTERKNMIDSVAGLTQMDGLLESLKLTIREQKVAIAEQERFIIEPIKPSKPEIASPEEIKLQLRGLDADAHEFAQAQAKKKPVKPIEPVKPTPLAEPSKPERQDLILEAPVAPELPPEVEGDFNTVLNELGQYVAQHSSLFAEWSTLCSSINTVDKLPAKYPTRDKLEEDWRKYHLREKLEQLKQSETINCPHCKKDFFLAHDEIAELEAMKLPKKAPSLTLAEWDALAENEIKKAQYDKLTEEVEALQLVAKRQLHSELVLLKPQMEAYQQQLAKYKKALVDVENKYVNDCKLWEIQCQNLRSQNDQMMTQYHIAKAQYEDAIEQFETNLKDYEAAQKVIEDLVSRYGTNILTEINRKRAELNEQLTLWQVYESKLEDYNTKLVSYQESVRVLNKQKMIYDEHIRAREATKAIKTKVQNFLIPALNKVASSLVREMTGGATQSVEIQSDFEVVVDKQPLRTLNGSTQDIANLALRIGLGRILTHKVLPVMMLDEIDSAMDEERALFTWECINKITPQIGQVLQASHKDLMSERRIEL